MVYKGEDRQSNNQYNDSVLELIYEDANKSLKFVQDNVNSINTRLTFLIGFNATFASLLPKLPLQNFFSIEYQPSQEFNHLYPYAEPFIKIPIIIIKWLLFIKPLIALLLAFSVALAILSVLPSSKPYVIYPNKMLEDSKGHSEEKFRIAIIKNREETIQRFQDLINKKASKLKYALVALGGAALLTVFDILTNINIQLN